MSLNFKTALDPKFAALHKDAKLQVETAAPMKALNTAKKFHAAYPNRAEANFEMARALSRVGKRNEAMPFAETASKLEPENANYTLVLGRIYLDFELYEYAAPLLKQAIIRLPNNLLMQWAMADFFFEVGNGHQARLHYEKALSLNPNIDQKPTLLKDYIKCLTTTDASAEAQAACRELEKFQGYEKYSLVRLSDLGKYKTTDKIAEKIREIADNSTQNSHLRSDALLSLGNIHNNSKQYDEAFKLWSASRTLRLITKRQEIGYHKLAFVKNFYPAELFKQVQDLGHQSDFLVFVVGMPRSGTTLTEQIIAAHPDAFGVGELGRMGRLEPAFNADYGNKPSVAEIVKNAKNNELNLRGAEAIKLFKILAGSNKKRVVDKLPTQYLAMGFISLLFPNAKFIHTQRHPADSFISAFQSNMSQFHEYSFDQNTYAETYLAKETMMAHWRTCFPNQIFELQYEKLVTNPEEKVRELLTFLNLPWDEKCLQFFNQKSTIKTLSKDQVRNPIYTSSVYRWKNYEKHLGPLFAALKAANFEYPEV